MVIQSGWPQQRRCIVLSQDRPQRLSPISTVSRQALRRSWAHPPRLRLLAPRQEQVARRLPRALQPRQARPGVPAPMPGRAEESRPRAEARPLPRRAGPAGRRALPLPQQRAHRSRLRSCQSVRAQSAAWSRPACPPAAAAAARAGPRQTASACCLSRWARARAWRQLAVRSSCTVLRHRTPEDHLVMRAAPRRPAAGQGRRVEGA